MDLNHYFSSVIIPRNSDTNFVQFPSFTGYSELVIYRHRDISISSGVSELMPIFRADGIVHDIHLVILATRVLGCIAVRIINTDTIYDEEVIFIEEWEIFSFELMGGYYFALVYTDLSWEQRITTNIPSDIPFKCSVNHGAFSIRNTLLDSIVFDRECSTMRVIAPEGIIHYISPEQYFLYIPDPLFTENQGSILSFLRWSKDILLEDTGIGILKISWSTLGKREFKKLIGFLGSYTCILPDELSGFIEFSRLSSVRDGNFEMPTTFETSEYISLIDPRWHMMRLGLLEMSYIASTLEESQRNIVRWIEDIDTLGDSHILLQRDRLMITSANIDEILPRYQSQRQLLIELLRNKIS